MKQQDKKYLFWDTDEPIHKRVDNLLENLTMEEKITNMASRQLGNPRLGLPEFHIGGEAAHGLMAPGSHTTVFPQVLGLSSTWDIDLLARIGEAVSDEARALYNERKGLSGLCLWAPTIDMERDPRWGRTEEAYGEDPLLSGELSGAFIHGMMGKDSNRLKTIPTPKHFYANNNEKDRGRRSVDIPEKIKREYYLRPFEIAVKQYSIRSLMTAYNGINGKPLMVHEDLEGVLRQEWGFDGFIVSDGGALTQLVDEHHYCSTYEEAFALSLKAGVDSMSDDTEVVSGIVRRAVEKGLVTEADLDKALRRVFTVRFLLGHFDPLESNPWADLDRSVIECKAHKGLALEAARKSVVLLENKILPLKSADPVKIAVLGPLADTVYKDWYTGAGTGIEKPLALFSEFFPHAELSFCDGSKLVKIKDSRGRYLATTSWYNGSLLARKEGLDGEIFRLTDWGWGNVTLQSIANGFFVAQQDNLTLSASEKEVYAWFVKSRFDLAGEGKTKLRAWDGKEVALNAEGSLICIDPEAKEEVSLTAEEFEIEIVEDGVEKGQVLAEKADYSFVFLGNNPVLVAKEEFDRPSIELPPEQERLLRVVQQKAKKTIGVIISSYPYALKGLEKDFDGLLWMAHGGPSGARALLETITGKNNPSGRLSMTWYRNDNVLGDIFDYDIASKGLTYRYIDAEDYGSKVLYPFSHGKSYTSFEYSPLQVISVSEKSFALGGVTLKLSLTNTGDCAGAELVRIFAKPPKESGGSKWELMAFKRVELQPRETKEVELKIEARQFLGWKTKTGWQHRSGRWVFSTEIPGNGKALELTL